mmetsp:Transcript_30195/g.44634  ORF Transcript_30195/g.44634 Transcript_30195/m.44634 type:complete len:460 (+) Transcript_30195:300-1679(+)
MGRYRVDDAEDSDDEHDNAIIAWNNQNETSSPMSQQQITPDTAAYMQAYQRDGTPVLIPVHQFMSPRRPTPWWLYMAIVAIIFQILSYYGPPAPPQSDQTWYEFGKTKGEEIMRPLLQVISVIPYVTKWCWQGMEDDFLEVWRKPSCVMQPVSIEENSWKDSIIGQSQAQSVVSEALQLWEHHQSAKGLVLVLSGTVGVGKRHMAEQISRIIVCDEGKLQIDGSEYIALSEILLRLRQHVQRYHGGMILITHPEDMEFGLLSGILDELSKTPHLITIITTHVGSRVIHKQLLQHDNSSSGLNSVSMDLNLREELDSNLGSGVSQYMTSIAPFVPLGPVEIQQILMSKAESLTSSLYTSLTMSPELAKIWTSPEYIEYYQGKIDGKSIMTFSSRGASLLETKQLMKLQSQLSVCITASSKIYDLVELDWDQGKAIIRACQTDEQNDDETRCTELCRFDLQ